MIVKRKHSSVRKTGLASERQDARIDKWDARKDEITKFIQGLSNTELFFAQEELKKELKKVKTSPLMEDIF